MSSLQDKILQVLYQTSNKIPLQSCDTYLVCKATGLSEDELKNASEILLLQRPKLIGKTYDGKKIWLTIDGFIKVEKLNEVPSSLMTFCKETLIIWKYLLTR